MWRNGRVGRRRSGSEMKGRGEGGRRGRTERERNILRNVRVGRGSEVRGRVGGKEGGGTILTTHPERGQC